MISLHCQVLVDPDQSQSLLVFTATPGSENQDKLRLLSVIGSQQLDCKPKWMNRVSSTRSGCSGGQSRPEVDVGGSECC